MSASVAVSTKKCYKSGWSKWQVFAESLGTSHVPLPTDSLESWSEGIWLPRMVWLTMSFCCCQFMEVGVKANTVCNYLAAVRHFLNLAGHNVDFLSSQAVCMTRSGMQRLQGNKRTIAVNKRRDRLPFVLEMINAFQTKLSRSKFSISSFGLLVGLKTAFACLLRRSEFIPSLKIKHWLRSDDVMFILTDGRVIPSFSLSRSLVSSVVEVLIHVKSSKCDQEGKGFTFVFGVAAEGPEGLCHLIMRWATAANLRTGSPFFAAFNEQGIRLWCITARQLTNLMRLVATELCGFSSIEALRFSPHSLRYGGASTLAAAELPNCNIQLAGRWKSEAFKLYLKASHKLFETTQSVLSESTLMTVHDVQRLARQR